MRLWDSALLGLAGFVAMSLLWVSIWTIVFPQVWAGYGTLTAPIASVAGLGIGLMHLVSSKG